MKNPYDILGIPQDANEAALREAYRSLARQYEDNPRRMDEINNAYDSIILARGSGGYAAGGGGQSQPAAEQYTAAPDFGDVRRRIQEGRFDDALTLLDGTPQQRRTAEWYYLKGCAQRGRGWLEEAEKLFYAAAEMDPGQREYHSAYEDMRSRRVGRQNGQTARKRSDDDGCCTICGGLICADCCCECLGGDGCC